MLGTILFIVLIIVVLAALIALLFGESITDGSRGIVFFWLLCLFGGLGFWVALGYVVLHFVAKAW